MNMSRRQRRIKTEAFVVTSYERSKFDLLQNLTSVLLDGTSELSKRSTLEKGAALPMKRLPVVSVCILESMLPISLPVKDFMRFYMATSKPKITHSSLSSKDTSMVSFI
jgi:hypothetical protein